MKAKLSYGIFVISTSCSSPAFSYEGTLSMGPEASYCYQYNKTFETASRLLHKKINGPSCVYPFDRNINYDPRYLERRAEQDAINYISPRYPSILRLMEKDNQALPSSGVTRKDINECKRGIGDDVNLSDKYKTQLCECVAKNLQAFDEQLRADKNVVQLVAFTCIQEINRP